MSYLVLARKYRPKTFTEMVGQEHVVQALTNALTTQRLHHAYLFTGTRGVGKTTVSRVLAKSLNCQGVDGTGGITANPCGVCQACTDIDAGRFVDYTELDAASNRGVDEVQSLLEQAVYKPVQGRFKVFMIDEVHMLTNTAFNAMLKTLEEPPEYLKFVLATTDPQKVPVTVLSRCLQFNLRPMAPETVLEHLGHVLGQENIDSEPQALRLLARAARGSMRDALSLTDQAIAYGGGQLQEAAVRQMLGSADRSHVFRLIEALAHGDGKSVVETSEALRLNGLSAAATLEDMSMVLQRMAVLQAVPDMAEADASDPEAAEMARLAGVMPPDETQLLYSLSLHGRQELGLAPDEYAALTMVLLRLLAFKPQATNSASASAEKKTLINPQRATLSPASAAAQPITQSVAQAPSAVQPQVPPAPPVVAQRQPEPQPAAPVQALPVRDMQPREVAPWEDDPSYDPEGSDSPSYDHDSDAAVVAMPVRQQAEPSAVLEPQVPTTEVPQIVATPEGEFWHKLVMEMSAAETINALVRELGLQSQLVARDTDTWMLRVERESLNSSTSRERLQKALETAGYPVRLTVEVGRVQDSPAKRNAAAAAQRQAGAEAIILNDTYVQSLMRDYGAKIVPGSIKPL
ncbi:MAG: DNA polymerase III subunit gamma/tau [Burkholderiales bacterium 35-55-47]|jgi:DNA polymerase-3 subunit gamma/tau|uniref:DNA polymerase III subunit gamma/tau n=1 Tax=Limnohabitans sp. TaxID=1907725 RepID=UPI000BD3436F|nr:DNA polymerase III subunit gamma/tau [Limnohabitans sp.]OYY17971.1 MAG: DNA polymerase III subunit gamma/tau [Burkholderiales bacterium 35-55-47]OYZ73491.1 MAG: DNA polymerase III subunit gamma/tau [Burkholderiales bacterium 24-55-52]OZB00637.1 MAG: DNA polymerase III subunit gamma/tau [Burkholderiales bacterium 39-55-53]HQR85618.1 DNA polymerase III subunit gamma/tau [Limnohabitans sp.]HQS26465.1 DNA polymerase III subunit gamma/tau [Limnohabitans sp.]